MFNTLYRTSKIAAFSSLATLLLAAPVEAEQAPFSLSFHPSRLPVFSAEMHEQNATASELIDSVNYSANTPAQDRLKYEQQLSNIRNSKGPFAPELSQVQLALAELYSSLGDYEAAFTAYENSMQVNRINQGLNSATQVPGLRGMIASKLALNDISGAHELHDILFRLQLSQHAQHDPEAIEAYLEWSDWNINLYMSSESSFAAPLQGSDSSRFRSPRLIEAYNHYANAMQIMQANNLTTDERMISTERKLAALNFMLTEQLQDSHRPLSRDFFNQQTLGGTREDRQFEIAQTQHFLNGSSALQRAIAYSYNMQNPDYDYIAARMMELGDWYLLFNRRTAAVDIYEEALQLLSQAKVPEHEAAQIISSGLPVTTPDVAYFSQPERPSQFAGYIDIEFNVSKYGIASDLEILSSQADHQIEKALFRNIRSSKFRPLFDAGEAVSQGKVQLRYYYTL